VVPVS